MIDEESKSGEKGTSRITPAGEETGGTWEVRMGIR